jgi:hypothetical protein
MLPPKGGLMGTDQKMISSSVLEMIEQLQNILELYPYTSFAKTGMFWNE